MPTKKLPTKKKKTETDFQLMYPSDRPVDLTFPCLLQPKYDGVRCVAVCEEEVKLLDKEGQPFKNEEALSSIKQFLSTFDCFKGLTLDGVLHAHTASQEKLLEYLSGTENKTKHKVYYTPFDVVKPNTDYVERIKQLNRLVYGEDVKQVRSTVCYTPSNVFNAIPTISMGGHTNFILKEQNCDYTPGRSTKHIQFGSLCKKDDFDVDFFESSPHGIEVVCKTPEGLTFMAELGPEVRNVRHLMILEVFQDVTATVKHFGLTEEGLPVLAVVTAIHEPD